MKCYRCLLVGILSFWASGVMSATANNAENEIAKILNKANQTYAELKDYTCLFSRKEFFEGKLKEQQGIVFKYQKPGRYYMKWPNDLIELVYAEGYNDNKMVIHGGLLFKFIRVAVPPSLALKHGRHTLMEADMGYLLKMITESYQRLQREKEGEIFYEGPEQIDGQATLHFKGVFPPDKGWYAHVVHVYLHQEHGLPLKLVVYDWQGKLLEQYEYSDLKLNTGLTEKDFDINNPSYMFNSGKSVDVQ